MNPNTVNESNTTTLLKKAVNSGQYTDLQQLKIRVSSQNGEGHFT